MSEHNVTISCEPVPGLGVSVLARSPPELPAQVVTNSPDEAWLRLTRPQPLTPFNRDERVRITYWDEEAAIYYWDGKINKFVGPDHRHISVMIPSPGVTLQRRRAFRVTLPMPLHFNVIDGSKTELVGV